MSKLRRRLARRFTGLWLSADFRRMWLSLTITSFGAQITNLALPLTAALMLHATPLQMGVLIALETLPFALFSLHAGVLIDRVRKLPIVIVADVSRALALAVIPLAAFTDWLSIEVLFAVGFFCGIQNVVGGAAYRCCSRRWPGDGAWSRRTRRSRSARPARAGRPGHRGLPDPGIDRAVRDPDRRVRVRWPP
jgi:MFS family permease